MHNIETGMIYFASVHQGEVSRRKVLKKIVKKETRCGCGCIVTGGPGDTTAFCPYCFSTTKELWNVCLRTYICWEDVDTGRRGECTAGAFLDFCRSDIFPGEKALETGDLPIFAHEDTQYTGAISNYKR